MLEFDRIYSVWSNLEPRNECVYFVIHVYRHICGTYRLWWNCCGHHYMCWKKYELKQTENAVISIPYGKTARHQQIHSHENKGLNERKNLQNARFDCEQWQPVIFNYVKKQNCHLCILGALSSVRSLKCGNWIVCTHTFDLLHPFFFSSVHFF